MQCRTIISLLAILSTSALAHAEEKQVSSPDGKNVLTFRIEDGIPYYRLDREDETLIRKSRLGVELVGIKSLDRNFEINSSEISSFDETWEQPWGEKKLIRNHYNQLKVILRESTSPKRKMALVFRVFDDGIGFRYEWPEQESLTEFSIAKELTQFALADDHKAWWIGAYQQNRYEFLPQETAISKTKKVHTPLTMETSSGLYLSFHEAALDDFASMTLANTGNNTLEADLVPWSDGEKVKTAAPSHSPWRTIQIAEKPGDLITSYLILNLNEPNALGDVSWVTPGKYAGVWWEMHLGTKSWGRGPTHGATHENVKKHIDFATENDFIGVLVEGWNHGWDGDWMQNGDRFRFTVPYRDFNIRESTRYAADNEVRIIGHHETGGSILNYEGQLEDALDYYSAFGINIIKTGYVAHGQNIIRIDDSLKPQREWHHGQHMVRHYRKVIREAARRQIMLNVHEPIKDTGERRTFPNMMTREGARGQEYEAWSEDGGNPPDYTTIIPFTRMLAGPMDYCPGAFDLLFEKERPDNRVNTTLTKQLALYVVLYSPLQMVPDLPENYNRFPDAFQFIRDVPTDWEDTQVLNAKIGDYVTIARQQRNSEEWYIGSITDEKKRELQLSMDFLKPNTTYQAEIYEDGEKADWKTNPYDYKIRVAEVDQSSSISLKLAPGGGSAIRIRPKIASNKKQEISVARAAE